MNCPSESQGGEASLVNFVAGKVRGPVGAVLRAHVDDCRRCSKFVAEQRALWQLLDVWEPEFEATGVGNEVAIRITSLPPEPWLKQTGRFVAARVWHPTFAVTAISALLVLGLYVRNPFASRVGASYNPSVSARAARNISPVEGEQIDQAIFDLQLLHQIDAVTEGTNHATRPM